MQRSRAVPEGAGFEPALLDLAFQGVQPRRPRPTTPPPPYGARVLGHKGGCQAPGGEKMRRGPAAATLERMAVEFSR